MSSTTTVNTVDVHQLAADVSHARADETARGCSNPIRLQGSSVTIDSTTGETISTYSSDDELDGHTYVRCGNRRASVCPSCSREYKGDAWHVLMAGLTGNGHDVPDTVAQHPSIFATLTAPSFGPVHRATGTKKNRRKSPCRARRDRPVCPHGRALSCTRRHDAEDRFVGQPLCRDCYDYTAHAIWQYKAPELWRRFTITLRRHLAHAAGLPVSSSTRVSFKDLARLSYTKVAEFQARGAVHFHAVIRLDGPHGPTTTPTINLSVDDLTHAVRAAAGQVYADAATPNGDTLRLRWGTEVDIRTITPGAGRDDTTGPAHPGMVGGYLAKYLTKSTEAFGLPTTGRVRSATDARHAGATDHAVRLIAAASRLVTINDDYRPIRRHLGTLGYRGHPITKSRAYSVTFRSRRDARRTWRKRQAHLAPNAAVRDTLELDTHELDDIDTTITLGDWRYAGRGYLDNFTAITAIQSATHARTRQAD